MNKGLGLAFMSKSVLRGLELLAQCTVKANKKP